MNKADLQAGLAQHYGSEVWYRHYLIQSMLYTEGVKFFADSAGGGAYWLLDKIALEVFFKYAKDNPFMSIKFLVTESVGRLSVDDGNDNVIFVCDVPYTDCPDGEWKFFLTDNVLLLTSEY